MKIVFVFVVIAVCLVAQSTACIPQWGWLGCPFACKWNVNSPRCVEACRRWPDMMHCPPRQTPELTPGSAAQQPTVQPPAVQPPATPNQG